MCASAAQTEPAPGSPFIALLLPLASGPFVQSAEAVRDGFVAAAKVQGSTTLPLRIYATSDEPTAVLAAYRQAVAGGARLIVGPLTRATVTALAATNSVPVPTLALNVPDGSGPPPGNLYMLSLQVEAEARLVARLVYDEGHRRIYTIGSDDPLSKRIVDAFVDAFVKLGGTHVGEQTYQGDAGAADHYTAAVEASGADAIFLGLDFDLARTVKPYLGSLPIYATSQVYPDTQSLLANYDLSGVRFVGMPWLLQPDHAAVMIYPHPDYGGDLDLERLYALGIDAFRIAQDLLAAQSEIVLDGVTGQLTLGPDHQFRRGLPIAEFTDGKLAVVGSIQP